MDRSLLDNGLRYLDRNWSVIPVAGKKAVVRWGPFQDGPPTASRLRNWFESKGDDITGLAVIHGRASAGACVRDYDRADAYQKWAETHPTLAGTLPTAETKRGFSVYFNGPEAYHVFPDGEYRGDPKHYTVLPPSRHPEGHVYRWIIPPGPSLPTVDPHDSGLLPCSAGGSVCSVCSALSVSTARSVCSARSALHDDQRVMEIIQRTLPTEVGQRHGLLFELARELKALADLTGAEGAALEPIVRAWHREALPVIGTKPFEESMIDFLKAWELVKYPAGSGPLDVALERATALQLPLEAQHYEQEGLRQLVALCGELQRVAGDGAFFLGCRSAAKVLGVDPSTASRWLFLLVRQGVLIRVSKGSRATRKASEFRYADRGAEKE